MLQNSARAAAEQLHAYMTFRAAREGVGHTLPVNFYTKAIRKGCVSFFGIQVRSGKLLEDQQRPDLFAEWTSPAGNA